VKKNLKSNSGFTLIELIIAIAILAFLMTAVSSFMGSGMLGFKKSKADITSHNSAQSTYNQMMDSIMQANDIIIYAYTIDTDAPDDGSEPVTEVDFSESGAEMEAELNPGPVYYVRDMKQWDAFKLTDECREPGAIPVLYKDIPDGTVLYVKEIIADTSAPIILSYTTPEADGVSYKKQITGEIVEIKPQTHKIKQPDGSYTDGEPLETASGEIIYNVNDIKRNIFTFDEETMYYQTRYGFMTAINDVATDVASPSYSHVYSESLSYVVNTAESANLTGCEITVDVNDGALDINLYFSDKNMTYDTQGMVKFRNSYVLRAKD